MSLKQLLQNPKDDMNWCYTTDKCLAIFDEPSAQRLTLLLTSKSTAPAPSVTNVETLRFNQREDSLSVCEVFTLTSTR